MSIVVDTHHSWPSLAISGHPPLAAADSGGMRRPGVHSMKRENERRTRVCVLSSGLLKRGVPTLAGSCSSENHYSDKGGHKRERSRRKWRTERGARFPVRQNKLTRQMKKKARPVGPSTKEKGAKSPARDCTVFFMFMRSREIRERRSTASTTRGRVKYRW